MVVALGTPLLHAVDRFMNVATMLGLGLVLGFDLGLGLGVGLGFTIK